MPVEDKIIRVDGIPVKVTKPILTALIIFAIKELKTRNPNFLKEFVEADHKGVSYKLPKDNELSKAVVSHFLEISGETLIKMWSIV